MAEHLYRIKLDTVFGMLFSNLIAFCVMRWPPITLNGHGITGSDPDHARRRAVRAGRDRRCARSPATSPSRLRVGVIGTGMLAVPVLAGWRPTRWPTNADTRRHRSSGAPASRPLAARRAASPAGAGGTTLIGTAIDFTPLDPIKAPLWSAIANGVVAVPIMAAR